MILASPPIQFQIESSSQVAQSINFFLANPIIATVLILVILFLVFWITLLILRRFLQRSNRVPAALKQKILLVSVPKESVKKDERQETPQTVQEEIGVAENIFSVLGGLRAQQGIKQWLFGRTDHFSTEIVLDKGKIYFYLAIPDYLKETLEQQIHSSYPHALIEETEDYNIFSPQGKVVGTYLKFGRDFIFPIKTFRKMEGDPLNALTNALAKISDNGEAAIQFVARSSHKRWHRKGVRVAREMQQGKSLSVALRRAGFGNIFDKLAGFISGIISFFISKKKGSENLDKPEEQYRLSPMEEEVVKGLFVQYPDRDQQPL